jgi:hypothetical protein
MVVVVGVGVVDVMNVSLDFTQNCKNENKPLTINWFTEVSL